MNKEGDVIKGFNNLTYAYPNIKNGFIQITTGAGGKLRKNWAPHNHPEDCSQNIVAATAHTGHFSWIQIEDKKLKMKAIASIGGAVLDSLYIDKNK